MLSFAVESLSEATWHHILPENFWQGLFGMVITGVVGLLFFLLFFHFGDRLIPGDMKQEIIDKQNTAYAILMGGALIAFGIIIAAAMK